MAKYGANYPCFKADNSATGIVIDKLVSASETPQVASGELYADDERAEAASETVGATLALETADLTLEKAAAIYGSTIRNGVLVSSKYDEAPLGKIAFYTALMRKGVKYYVGYIYPKAKAALGNQSFQTKGNNITFSTTSTTFTVFTDDDGEWKHTKEFDSALAAKEWINEQLSIPSGSDINIFPKSVTVAPGGYSDTVVIVNATGTVTATPSNQKITADMAANNKNVVIGAAADATAGDYTVTLTDSATIPKTATINVTVTE